MTTTGTANPGDGLVVSPPHPQYAAIEVGWSTCSTLATATGTSNFLRPSITPISQANLQLRRSQRCDFCSDLRIGSCADVKRVVECASPRALKLQN